MLATTGSLNDFVDTAATVTKAVGAGGEALESAAPFVAAPISGAFLAHGLASGDSQQTFDGGYGLLTLGIGMFAPPVGLGMALGKVVGDATGIENPNQNDPNILDEAAQCH